MKRILFLLISVLIAAGCAAQSVLRSGRWVKVAVETDGVYRLPYSKLRSLGFADPQKVRIYGNHDGMLPFVNDAPRTNDLHENKVFHDGDCVYFYATGADVWAADNATGMILPRRHLYSRKAFYFLTDNDNGNSNSMPKSAQTSAIQTVNEGNFWYGHEEDLVNLTMSGRSWYGENFFYKNEQLIDFQCNAAPKSGKILTSMICRSSVKNGYTVEWGDGAESVVFENVTGSSPYADTKNIQFQCTPQSFDKQTVKITFDKKASSAECYLDFVVINTVEPLRYNGRQMIFGYNGNGTAAKFAVENAPNQGFAALDVSDANNPALLDCNVDNGTGFFTAITSESGRYIVFNLNDASEPEYLEAVENQDLHAINSPDFLIIAPTNLIKYARQIKDLHPELTTEIVSNTQIFNEFSSGMVDVSAIRDFIKYLYDKDGGKRLKYVLLFGDGSVDNITVSENNPNLIPTYQSASSLNEIEHSSIVSDDYFGLLGDDEGETDGALDVAIGRLPVKNEAEAEVVVRKIAAYIKGDFSSPWRKAVAFIADDENANTHNTQADFMAVDLETNHPEYDVRKIYLDAYQQESSATGNTYPQAREDVNRLLQQGAFSITYVGHGGMKFFADERILTLSDINSARNGARLPIFITASCNIGHFDYYDRNADKTVDSPAERLILNPEGGAIAMFTTTREVLSSPNFALSKNIHQYLFSKTADHGGAMRLGDVIRQAKLETNDYNMLSFTLLGDPALRVPFPEKNIEVESIDGVPFHQFNDTIKAMSTHIINFKINDLNGASGTAWVTFFDKPTQTSTLDNDGHGAFQYEDYKTKIFAGSATVRDGKFTVKFTVPKDIDYNANFGKLSLYAICDGIEASGVNKKIIVGSSSSDAPDDYIGPKIIVTTSDGKPIDGMAFTVSRPTITVALSDTSGINTAGRGHDITLTIDDNGATHTLTDYYTAAKDYSNGGTITYQLPKLKDGSHTLKLKAWDNLNNSNEITATFSISSSSKFAISHLLNYPNPFTDHTGFYFEQNSAGGFIDYEITIFTMSGKIVRTLTGVLPSGESRCGPIDWDGLDNYGNRIARGVYFYRLRIRDAEGRKAVAREKLLYLK